MKTARPKLALTPTELSGLAALRFAPRLLFEPLVATRDIHASLGPFVILKIPRFLPFILTVGASFNREILNNPASWRGTTIFRGGPKNSAAKRLGNGLVRMTDARHFHYRRLYAEPLRKPNVATLGERMASLAQEELASWPLGETVDLRQYSYRLIRIFAIELMFGGDRSRGFRIADEVSQLLQRGWSLSVMTLPVNLPFTPYGRMLRAAETLERDSLDWGEKKRDRRDDRDLLSILVNSTDEMGNPPDDAVIAGQVPQLFGATFETCQYVLISTLLLLMQHPQVTRELYEELRNKLDDNMPTLQAIDDLPLLEAVVKESLRILPPAPIQMRVARQDTSVGGYAVAKGARALLNIFLSNRQSDRYPDANRFQPGRWATINPTPFEFPTFSAGPHSCIGYWFAMSMIKIAIASILTRFRLSVTTGAKINYRVTPGILSPATIVPVALYRQDEVFAGTPIRGNVRNLVQFPC